MSNVCFNDRWLVACSRDDYAMQLILILLMYVARRSGT